MENLQWSTIRAETGRVLHYEYKLNQAREAVERAETELEHQRATERTLKKRQKKYRKKLSKATDAEKRVRYNKKLAEIDEDYNDSEGKVARLVDELNGRQATLEIVKDERKGMRMELEQMLRVFCNKKWVLMMGLDDLAALRMMRDLGEGLTLTFTIGSSVREDIAERMRWIMSEMSVIADMKSSHLYELTKAGGFRTLTKKELKKLKYPKRR